MRSLGAELIHWANGRPDWQQSVMSRLARGEILGQADYKEVAKQLANGDGAPAATIPLPDSSGVQEARPPVALLEVTTGKGVNALAQGQRLSFGPKGLTVVYGDNGSGKSGYARLLKQVVGARVQEEVLSNIFSDDGDTRPAAEIVFSVGGVTSEPCDWFEAPPELGRIGFFDESCGDAYVTRESEVTFRPAELFILDGLIEACDGIRGELDQIRKENVSRPATLPAVSQGGSAARFLADLSGSTATADIDDACRVDSWVPGRIEDLKQLDARLRSSDPSQMRTRLEHSAERYELVAAHLRALHDRLGPDVENGVAEKRRLARELRAAATIAAQQSFENEPIAGVGSDTWRALWEAARRFSQAEAYAGEEFPMIGPEARCVLCQQYLDADARSRLGRFEVSVGDETERRALAAEREANAAVNRVQTTEVGPAEVLAALELLKPDDPELTQQSHAAIGRFEAVAQAIVSGCAAPGSDPVPNEGTEGALRGKAIQARNAASRITDIQYAQQIQDITNERTKLEDCVLMGGAHAIIREEISRLAERDRIEHARQQSNTTAMTRKATEFTRSYVTSQLQENFANEAQRLRIERVVLKDVGGQKGRLRNKPAFENAVQNPSLDRVLSEGEQNALGLAGFFAEASLAASRSALVLDDPVSSLDHVHRELVASRLAEFAADRQVIVFTHDLAFVSELHQATSQAETVFVERSVELQGDGTPGACIEGHPWKAQAVGRRFDELERDLARIKKTVEVSTQEQRVRETADWAGKLSETWERIVRATITRPLFDPGTQHVSPQRFRLLVDITSEDNKEFQESYSRISRWARRHDKSAEVNYVPPAIDDMREELGHVRTWFDRIRKYGN